MPDYVIRPFRPGDEEGILATFNATFGENNPDFVPRTRAEWDWAFARNPAGRRIWVAECDGMIAAQCASLPFRVLIDGEESTITQGVDAMVHPDHRRGLRRPGLYVATARPFFAEFRGPGKDILHYGWPVEPAWRIGKTFLGYEIVRTQTIHMTEPGTGPSTPPEGVERVERFDASVRALYERCRSAWGLSVIRDDVYLNWRFVDNPRFDYHIDAVRDGAGYAGYAVFRKADFMEPGTGVLMDWLVDPDDARSSELLHEAVLARARQEGARALVAVFPDWSPWFQRFQDLGWRVYASNYLLIGIVQDPHYDTWWLRDHWWYQLAELDVI